eukprot:4915183-Pyramimonas_sp.AAC.1
MQNARRESPCARRSGHSIIRTEMQSHRKTHKRDVNGGRWGQGGRHNEKNTRVATQIRSGRTAASNDREQAEYSLAYPSDRPNQDTTR